MSVRWLRDQFLHIHSQSLGKPLQSSLRIRLAGGFDVRQVGSGHTGCLGEFAGLEAAKLAPDPDGAFDVQYVVKKGAGMVFSAYSMPKA